MRFCSRFVFVTAALSILLPGCGNQRDTAGEVILPYVGANRGTSLDESSPVAHDEVGKLEQSARDGQILSSKPWTALPTFDSLDDFSRNYFPRAVYEEARTQTDFEVLEITYSSDGIPVPGMLIEPRIPGDQQWPVIIFNRGGTGDYSRITDDGVTPCSRTNPSCLTVVDLYQFAKAGFVVIASDYRFHGTMAYIALDRGIPVKAAAVIAGPSDLKAWADLRPDLVNGDQNYDGFSKVWPDYEHRSAEYYRARSAVFWADQIKVPVLILHSRTDSFVPVTQALRMAEALQEKSKVYALHIYDHDGHSLPLNREDRNRKIIDWFNKFGGADGTRR